MRPTSSIAIQNSTDVAAARREVLFLCRSAGFGEEKAGDAAIVVTETASNILKHGRGGEILLNRHGGRIEVVALDKGPGAPDAARWFQDGFSTSGTSGTGLGAVRRLSDFCDLYTSPGAGTVVVAHLGGVGSDGILNVPYPGETVCGDSWLIQNLPRRKRLFVIDGLGHGSGAAEAARAGIEEAQAKEKAELPELMEALHSRLRPTRGAAASAVDIAADGSDLKFSGVGNVVGLAAPDALSRRQMISVNGTLGHEVRKFQVFAYPAKPRSLVILHSDGLTANWSFEKYPGLFIKHPAVIAAVLLRDFRRHRDDATIIAVRLGADGA